MRRMRKTLSYAAIAAAIVLFAGCSSQEESAREKEAQATAPPASVQAPQPETEERDPVEKETDNSAEAGKPPEENKNNISLASPEVEEIQPVDLAEMLGQHAENSTQTGTVRKNPEDYDVSTPFHPDAPTLMGLTVGTDAMVVLEQFGEPHAIHELPEDLEDARVFTYPGFAVGIQEGEVLFVEVNTSSVNPGLNGFRLGYTREEALMYLGEPTTSTEYVLNYIADGVVLKLDTDPQTNRIHSIKLFADE